MSSRNLARTETLSDQKQALWDYLDALLQEVPEEASQEAAEASRPAGRKSLFTDTPPARQAPAPSEPAAEAPAPEPPAPRRAPVTRLRQALAEPEPTPPAPEIEEPVGEPEPEPVVEQAETTESAPPREEPAEATVPEWAEPDFQALIFHVGGLKLAVPLVKLHSVVPWEEQVTPMPNQPRWCHGLFNYRGHNVRVVDTATLVLPEDKRHSDGADEPTQMLVVGDGRWAMSCTRVGDVVRLKPDQVKWRTAGGQRPWLAGTVREQLCAVMDTDAFADMLDKA